MRTSAPPLLSLRASCVLPTRPAIARRGPSARPVTTLERGLSGATTISPPRAAETAVAAPPAIGERGVRAGRRANPDPAPPAIRREAARRMSPS
eukprot:4491882-Alexandrium_andersonii.AAC.1